MSTKNHLFFPFCKTTHTFPFHTDNSFPLSALFQLPNFAHRVSKDYTNRINGSAHKLFCRLNFIFNPNSNLTLANLPTMVAKMNTPIK